MDTDIAVFDRVITVNARGALLVSKYTSASMIRLGVGGAIVNVSSQAGLVALKGHISYGSSKAALDNITRVSALELGKYGIRVNSVNPSIVMTPMSAWYWRRDDVQGPFLSAMPLGRWATEDEIAAPIVFLLSDGASMITGCPCRSTVATPASDGRGGSTLPRPRQGPKRVRTQLEQLDAVDGGMAHKPQRRG
jgi:NAD(P)-dependent dehydrogenase (short-subunit alcohol dehydrogenase family)